VTGRFQVKFAQRTMIIIAIYHALKNCFRLAEQIARLLTLLLLQCTPSVLTNARLGRPSMP
jgi:hypothetical protein